MKKLFLMMAVLTAFGSANHAEGQTVERPRHGYTSTQTVELDKVVFDGNQTRVYLDVYRLRQPFSFDEVTLTSDGVGFDAVGVEEITETGGKAPENVEPRRFVLTFAVAPERSVPVSLTGQTNEGPFAIYDIDLSGRAPAYRPELPAEAFAGEWKSGELPEPQLRIATTTVNLHMTGIENCPQANGPVLWVYNPFTGENRQVEPETIGCGEFRYEFEQYATGKVVLAVDYTSLSIASHPGETIDIWLDMTAFSLKKSRYRSEPDMLWVYFTGELSDINNAAAHAPDALDPYANQFPRTAFHLDRSKITVEEYVKGMMQKIEDDTALIMAEPGLTDRVREARILEMKTKCLRAVREMKIMLGMYKHNEGVSLEKYGNLLYLLRDAGLNDPKLLYGSEFPATIPDLAVAAGEAGVTDAAADTPRGWMQDWRVFPILRKAETRQPVTAAEEDVIAAAEPYYRELYAHLKETTEKEYNAALGSGKFAIRETPEYDDPADLLQNIVNNYPGKVVFVDFWATWCGPCLNGMRAIRPLKPEMKEHGVVSVYITTESSPRTKWTLSLPDIGGEHYYLSEAEWKTMLEKYGFKGIPTYMIFDKDGRHFYQSTGFPGVDTLRQELGKVL